MLSREWMNMCLCKEQWVNSNRSVAYKKDAAWRIGDGINVPALLL